MGATISQSESNVASFFADDDEYNSNYNNSNSNSTNYNNNNNNCNDNNIDNNNNIKKLHHLNIYCVGCSDGGKTSFHNQLKSKFHMKIHKNEKTRITLILKTCLSSIQDVIFVVMSDHERNEFIHKIKKSDPQIYDFLLNLTNITRKWEFSKSESIQYGQYIRMIWSKYKIIQDLYFQYKDSHHLIDNIDILCSEMNIIMSQISDHQKNQFLKNTKKRLNQRLNIGNSIDCNQYDNQSNLYQQDDEDDDYGEDQDVYQLDNHINNILNNQKKEKKISLFSSKFKSNFNSNSKISTTDSNNSNNSNNNGNNIIDKYSPLIRFLTIGKSETNFQFDSKNSFTILDLGGRGGEKKKWEFFLNETTADVVLFFVSMSEFNQNLIENDHVNRLIESLNVYKDVINRALLRNVKDIILIFTKPDIFKIKKNEFYLPNMEGVIKKEMRPELGKLNENIKNQVSDLINLFENIHLNSFNNRKFKYHIVNTINVKECQEFIEILLRQVIVKDYIENTLQKQTSIDYYPFISKCLLKESQFFINRVLDFSDCTFKIN